MVQWALIFLVIQWALILLVVAMVAGWLGLSGIAGVATNIAWILFWGGMVLAAMFYFRGRGMTSQIR